jgi:dihydroorotate dehydrogenase
MLFSLLRPALFALDGEPAHRLSIAALRRWPLAGGPLRFAAAHPGRRHRLSGPLGIAPGYDKNAEAPDALLALGFGFAEGRHGHPAAASRQPAPAPVPLVEDRAVINRMGFNNDGGAAVLARLERRKGKAGVVGVNIGANKDSPDRIADYARLTAAMAPVAAYLTVNISSPNTPACARCRTKAR